MCGDGDGAWKSAGRKKGRATLSKAEAWNRSDIVAAAQLEVNQWCLKMSTGAHSYPKQKPEGGDLIVCLWVYFQNSGRIQTQEETNQNPGQRVSSAVPGKVTVCAEDIMYRKHSDLARRTLYSIAFNVTRGMSWPACRADHGGCNGLLARLEIEEPPYSGLERDLGGVRIYDT